MIRPLGTGVVFVVLLTLTLGCGDRPGKEQKGKPKGQQEPGWVFGEPNDKFHVRLFIDIGAKKATAKILDADIKELVPITAPSITLIIKGDKEPITLEAQGEKGKPSAVFAVTHDKLAAKVEPKNLEVRADIEGKGKNLHFSLEEDDHKH